MNGNVMAGDENGKGKFSFSEDYIKIWKGAHEIAQGQTGYMDKTYADLSAGL